MIERKVWGVYDCRDHYVNVLHDNRLYADEAEANRTCEALNAREGYGFDVEEHLLVEPPIESTASEIAPPMLPAALDDRHEAPESGT